MSKELKPCPFCGSNARFHILNKSDGRGWLFNVECSRCNITLNDTFQAYVDLSETGEVVFTKDERQKAIEEWNTRKDVE